MTASSSVDRRFTLMFLVMLTIAAGNTALQSVLPALGRSLGVKDSAVAAAFSVSALLWVVAAPFWADRSDRHGKRAMILLGVGGFSVSLTLCGLFLAAGINHWIGGTLAFVLFIGGRLIYGTFGSAAPPAVQAIIAGETTRGLVMGHAQAMTSQAIGFLVIDRLHVAPDKALEPTGIVLMMGAGAALLAQWGVIPRLNLAPRALVLVGLMLAAAGTALTGLGTSLYTIATAYALASLGFGFTRPGFTAGASLAVGAEAQGSVAGKVTSVNGASFVLGPSIGVGLYELRHSLPYLAAGAACAVMIVYAWAALRD
ncbi:MFS transporter [uncultured Sphingomonas sp.]|uniref:MFS transporter n=1 Tax=uncultured Sphingomonas sp. TaxID=158754 RepID=UPI0035CA277F